MPNTFIHEPWKMTNIDKQFFNLNIDYPQPKINLMIAGKRLEKNYGDIATALLLKKKIKRIVNIHTRNHAIHQR